jgi:predicted nucleic acid-binding protein
MAVVSNTSPVLNLAIIGRLDLMREQFGQVIIPEAVWQELRLDEPLPGTDTTNNALQEGWLKTGLLREATLVRALEGELDAGETEAIALAVELGLTRVLLDEREARLVAKRMGLEVTGVLGILLRAKATGSIVSLHHEIQSLQHEAGFWIHDELVFALLREAGEQPEKP